MFAGSLMIRLGSGSSVPTTAQSAPREVIVACFFPFMTLDQRGGANGPHAVLHKESHLRMSAVKKS